MVFVDYPIDGFLSKNRKISFHVKGDKRIACRMAIIPNDNEAKLPAFTVRTKGSDDVIDGNKMKDGHLEYQVYGCDFVEITW
jgi:hypothetical protein